MLEDVELVVVDELDDDVVSSVATVVLVEEPPDEHDATTAPRARIVARTTRATGRRDRVGGVRPIASGRARRVVAGSVIGGGS